MNQNSAMDKKDIFISYSHKDKIFVDKLTSDLEKKGVKVWQDEKEIEVGDRLTEKIRKGIDSAKYLCVVLSKNSINSEWVKVEVDIAQNYELNNKTKKVLPLLVDNIELPWFLLGKYYAPFNESYGNGFLKLIETIKPSLKNLFVIKNFIDTVDLFDNSGKKAIIQSDWLIKVEKGNLTEWARCLHFDGKINKVTTKPESEILIKKTGLFYTIRFILKDNVKSGDTLSFRAKFEVNDTFLQKEEWWGISGGKGPCQDCLVFSAVKEDDSKIKIIFPTSRPYTKFNTIVKRGEIKPSTFPVELVENNRKVIFWENLCKKELRNEEHMIVWNW